jgi:hypothetical protein
MKVFIYDENSAEPNFAINGKYDKGVFTWIEKKGILKKAEKHMDIIWKKTIKLPTGNKGTLENCTKACFDGMNYVQIGWAETDLSKITSEERQMSRANFVRDYESMTLDDNNKITNPANLLALLGPWFLAAVVVLAVIAIVYEANTFSMTQKPLLQNFSIATQDNHVILEYLFNQSVKNNTNVKLPIIKGGG